MRSANAWDTTIAIVTPENIAFDYELAGPFRRVPAYAIDLAVRWGIIFLLFMLLTMTGMLLSIQSLGSIYIASLMIAYFLISWFYGTFMETYFNGRTIGKWATGLRVISVDGRPIDGTQAVIRNLLRIADMAPVLSLSVFSEDYPSWFAAPTGVIGTLTMICTQRMQRIGDLAAGTMVVVDERAWRLPISKVEDPRVPALASYIPKDYRITRGMAKTLAVYCERRAYLTPARRREIATHLSQPLLERFGFRPDIDPDLLMVALYHFTFLFDAKTDLESLGPYAQVSPYARDVQASANTSKSSDVAGNAASKVADKVDETSVITAELIEAVPASNPAPRTEATT